MASRQGTSLKTTKSVYVDIIFFENCLKKSLVKRLSRKPWASLGGNGDAERTKGQAPWGVLLFACTTTRKEKEKEMG